VCFRDLFQKVDLGFDASGLKCTNPDHQTGGAYTCCHVAKSSAAAKALPAIYHSLPSNLKI